MKKFFNKFPNSPKKQQEILLFCAGAMILVLAALWISGDGPEKFSFNKFSNAVAQAFNQEGSTQVANPWIHGVKYDNLQWWCGNTAYDARNSACSTSEKNAGDGNPAPRSCTAGSGDGDLCSNDNVRNVYGVFSVYDKTNAANNGYTAYFTAKSTGNRHSVIWDYPSKIESWSGSAWFEVSNKQVNYINREYLFDFKDSNNSSSGSTNDLVFNWTFDVGYKDNPLQAGEADTTRLRVPANTPIVFDWECQAIQTSYFTDNAGFLGGGNVRVGHRLNLFDRSINSFPGINAAAGTYEVTAFADFDYEMQCRTGAHAEIQSGSYRHTYPARNGRNLILQVEVVNTGDAAINASVNVPATSIIPAGGSQAPAVDIDWQADWVYSASLTGPTVTTNPSFTTQSCSRTACNGQKTVSTGAFNSPGVRTYTLSYTTYGASASSPTTNTVTDSVNVQCTSNSTWTGGQCVCNGPTYVQSGSQCVVQNSPSLDINASPSTVDSGQTSTITWSASNVSSCYVQGSNGDGGSGVWTGLTHTGSGRTTSPLTSNTTYTLYCTTGSGSPYTDTVTVSVNGAPEPEVDPTIASFEATPDSVRAGNTTTLVWSINDLEAGDQCMITSSSPAFDDYAVVATPGEIETPEITQPTSFTLSCAGGAEQITVMVLPSVIEI